MDNTSKDNKNQFVLGFLTYLVDQNIFKKIYVSFLVPGHTHEDIDQCFSVLTKSLRNNTAYTFEDWKRVVENAFTDDYNKIHHVEYVWSTLDYRTWLSTRSYNSYKDYRSNAYHFRIMKTSEDRPAIAQYTQFCYEGDYSCVHYNAEYFPRGDGSAQYSFLRDFLEGNPETDQTAGTWLEKRQGSDEVSVNDDIRKQKILELLRLETNSATESDEQWWCEFWNSKPEPGKPVKSNQTWIFRLPNVLAINSNCSADHMDIFDLNDVKPLSPFKHEMLVTQKWSRTCRRDAVRLAEAYSSMTTPGEMKEGSFVIFNVQQPEWSEIARDQTGIHPDALKTDFGLGKVIERRENCDHVSVHIWYASNAGDPNGTWIPWQRKSTNPKETKSSPWVKDIPVDSILLTGIQLKQSGKYSFKLSSQTKKSIHQHPDLSYGLLPGVGLVSRAFQDQTLEENVLATKGCRSKSALKRHKTAVTKLNKSRQQQHVSQTLKRRKAENRPRLKNITVNSPNLKDSEPAEPTSPSLQSTDSSVRDEDENFDDIPVTNSDTVQQSSADALPTTITVPACTSNTLEAPHVAVNQRYGFRNQSQEVFTFHKIGDEVKCRYRNRNTYYKARILGFNTTNGTYSVEYEEFGEIEDNVKPFRLSKLG